MTAFWLNLAIIKDHIKKDQSLKVPGFKLIFHTLGS